MSKLHYKENPCRDEIAEELYVTDLELVDCASCLRKNKKVEPASELCGHVNRHSFGTDRKLDNLTCDLLPGHTGDHSAIHKELQRTENAEIIDGKEVTEVTYEEVEIRRGWGDMAGTPVSEIPTPPPAGPLTMLELENRVKQLEADGKWNPDKTLAGV